MANERLYQFPPKTTPVPADILFLGDSADGWNESSSTIAQVISAYPNLSSLAQLTLTANQFPYLGNSGAWASGTITTLALTLLADATIANVLNTLTLPIGLTTPTGTGNAVLDTSPTINTPTLTNPTVSTGTFTNPTVTTGTFTSPAITTPTINQGLQNQPTINQPNIYGVITNSTASTGQLGQIVQSIIPSTSAVAFADSEVTPITSINLTAGDWDIWANISYISDFGNNCSLQSGWISTSDTVRPDMSVYTQIVGGGSTVLGYNCFSVTPITLQLDSTTSVYLLGYGVFTASTLSACGGIFARRRR